MKAGWEIKTLDEVCIVERGSSPRPIKEFFTTEPDGVNWIKIGDTEEGGKYVFSTRQKITPEGAKQSRYVKEGDFILTNSMSFGRPYIMKTDGYIHDGWFVLRLKDSIDADYFYHLLSSNLIQEQFTQLAAGAIVKNISGDLVKKAVLPIAPLPEQKRLVTLLDEAFESIATAKANAQQNLKNARALFESHLNEVFTKRGEGWEDRTIGSIAEIKGGKRVPKGYKLLSEPTDYLYLRVADFTDEGSIDMSNLRYIDAEVHRQIKNYIIYSSDLYISIAGTIGKTGIIPEELNGANLTENACRLVFKSGINNRFIYYFTLTTNFIEQVGLNTRTSAQPKLALSRLSTIELGITSITEQKRLAMQFDTIIEETQRLEALYSRKIAALDELKKALLHRAFSGEL
jgi:type I restriction enzyme S subunit